MTASGRGMPIGVSVERLLADLVVERARRQTALDVAEERLAGARARLLAEQEGARRDLAEHVAKAEAEIVAMEEAHQRALQAIRDAAAQQADEILMGSAAPLTSSDTDARRVDADR